MSFDSREHSALETIEGSEKLKRAVVKLVFWKSEIHLDPAAPEQFQDPNLKPVGTGSGFFVRSDGYIMTNKHCTMRSTFTIELSDGKKLTARVKYRDAARDIALLKVDGENFEALPLGDSDELRWGQSILLVGAPRGMKNSITRGIISGLPEKPRNGQSSTLQLEDWDPESDDQEGELPLHENFIRTDSDMHQGNSGGPMTNEKGEVIGINTLTAQTREGGIGFALPVNEVRPLIENMESFIAVSNVLQSLDWSFHEKDTEKISLTDRFNAAINAAHGALIIGSFEDDEIAKKIKAVMGDRGIRRIFQNMLVHPATKTEKYAALYERKFGVALYESKESIELQSEGEAGTER